MFRSAGSLFSITSYFAVFFFNQLLKFLKQRHTIRREIEKMYMGQN